MNMKGRKDLRFKSVRFHISIDYRARKRLGDALTLEEINVSSKL